MTLPLPPLYPANLRLRGQRCLVVGGGSVAEGKVAGLLEAEAAVHVVASEVSAAIADLEACSDVTVTAERRPYRRGEAASYRLVIAATNDADVNGQVFEDAEAAGVWVNAVDDPAHCTFTAPSSIRRGDLLVTFSTGGRSPAMAGWLRRRFEEEFGPEYETLLTMLADARGELARRGQAALALDWHRALDSGMLELIREGRLKDAKERLQACLSSSSD